MREASEKVMDPDPARRTLPPLPPAVGDLRLLSPVLRGAIVETVERLEGASVSALTELLMNVSARARFPQTRQPLTLARG